MHPLARHIYLASRSSRRRELLKQIGVSFEVLLLREGPQRAADFDETPLADEAPDRSVARLAGLDDVVPAQPEPMRQRAGLQGRTAPVDPLDGDETSA